MQQAKLDDKNSYPCRTFVAVGLVIMMVGSGSLKNNLNAFGGGQHKLPEQKMQLETYFSVQYFGVKCGSFLARVLFPMIRADVKCFGSNDCYSLSFGIPAVIMLIATVVFLSGSGKYIELKPNGNMLVKVIKCVKVTASLKFIPQNPFIIIFIAARHQTKVKNHR
jgi:solute carrier family 15 oligopeptide transporter 1